MYGVPRIPGEFGVDLTDLAEPTGSAQPSADITRYPELDQFPELAMVIRDLLPRYAHLDIEGRLELSRDIARKAKEVLEQKEKQIGEGAKD